jgi:polar amino acid transport system substrate-binding protein
MLETFNQEGGSVIIHKYPNEFEKVKSLLTGQSDVIIGNQYVIHDVVRNQLRNDESRHITFNPKPLRVTPLHVLFSRQHPQSALWVSQFNRGLRQLKMSGDYQRAWSAFRMGEYGLIGIPAEQP